MITRAGILGTALAASAALALTGCDEGAGGSAGAAPPPGGDTTERTITGTGTGRVRGTPDTMTVELGVETRAATAQEALGRNREKALQVLEALRAAGVEEDDIQTSQLSVYPSLGDDDQITGYEVLNAVTATLHELDRAGAVIDAAAAVAGDDIRVHGIWFSIEDTSDLVTRARAEAVEQARSEAEQLAAAAELELDGVVSIEETSAPPEPVVDAGAAEDQVAETPINPGTQELAVEVVVRFAIA